jgi:hypothetical protein
MADLKTLRREVDRFKNVHKNFDMYDDWHERPANRERNFFAWETYQAFTADMVRACDVACDAYERACIEDQLAKERAARVANKKAAAMGRRPRSHIRKTIMIDGVRTKLERA